MDRLLKSQMFICKTEKIYCPPPLSRQRKRKPTAEEPESRRKTRLLAERWGKGVAALDPTLNQAKAGALRAGRVPDGGGGRQRGLLVADSLVGFSSPPGVDKKGS